MRLLHHWHVDPLRAGNVERDVGSVDFAEFVCPACLEVDGIGQHKSRVGVEDARSEQIPDFAIRLLFDPRVDCLPSQIGLLEI